jgi:hypothetical protein
LGQQYALLERLEKPYQSSDGKIFTMSAEVKLFGGEQEAIPTVFMLEAPQNHGLGVDSHRYG